MSMPPIANVGCCVSTPLQAQGWVRTGSLCLWAVAALLLLPLAATASALPAPTLDQVQQKMAGLAVPFEANQGQFAPEVAFSARTFAGTLFVTRDGRIVHALAGKPEAVATERKLDDPTRKSHMPRGPGWALVESLQGAGKLAPAGSQPSATHVSRFEGGAMPNQTSNIATFDRVSLGSPWPGVSVELAARGSNVEKLFTVAPGSNPKTIRMRVTGAKRLRLGGGGSLLAATGNGDVAFTPPVAFQEIGGKRNIVPVRYKLLADNNYRFEIVGNYDHSEPLVIDPLLQATYIGGSGDDRATALVVDAGGNVLVAGTTPSTNFPGTAGGAQPAYGGSFTDAFVARLSSNLTTLVQATYLGGSGSDGVNALAIDAGGNVLVAGYTGSIDFPGTTGGAQPASGGGFEAVVARLSSNLTTLLQATYLGGNGSDDALALAIDAGGSVLVAGETESNDFPGTTGGAQPAKGTGGDAFVARLSSNLAALIQATYLGGNYNDQANALAIDAGGNVLVAGVAGSSNFPGTVGGAQPANGGGINDSFVARLSNNLATLLQATYLGGSGNDRANALALDPGGNVLVAGVTNSTNFPGTTGGAQPVNGGGDGAFVARLSGNLTALVQATYLGGSLDDQATALAVDAGGNVLIAGFTHSGDFPGTAGGAQPLRGGGFVDAFVARLSSSLKTLVQATYLGGSDNEQATALALDAGGNVVVAGYTASTNFPDTTGGAQPANGGGANDVFVAKLTPDLKASNDLIFANGFE